MLDLKSLIGKLDGFARDALESSAGLAVSRTHYNVEIEHWLLRLLDAETADAALICNHFAIDRGKLARDLNRALDRTKTGNGRAPSLSPHLVRLVREAWLGASLRFNAPQVRSGHVLLALVGDADLALLADQISPELDRINAETLADSFAQIAQGSSEGPLTQAGPATQDEARVPSRGTGTLDKYCADLTQQARDGRIDPVLGRDPEIRQIVDILMRRRQNNPILTGEAGVGKTAVVEGFALRIAEGDVPDALKGVRLLSLDLGLLQAGAGVKGEFENRLKTVIEEVKTSAQPIIMFIDEAHTLIGAGGTEGQGDAANLLKPALARGEMRTIAATTWAEYKKYFEKDPALTRRFQVVKVDEPDEPTAIVMMRGLVATLETHHGVTVLDSAVEAAVSMSSRYIPGRQLPDKAVSLLDTACARVAISQAATPPAVEDAQRQIQLLETEERIRAREAQVDGDVASLEAVRGRLEAARSAFAAIQVRWQAEKAALTALTAARQALAEDGEAGRTAYAAAKAQLEALQGEAPLMHDRVDRQAVAEVVAGWTGIPVGRMMSDQVRQMLTIDARIRERIRGQDQAVEVIASVVQSAGARLADPRKPLGVFLLCGTSGVGKTETALTLAELLYGGEQNMTVINMSEFKEEHKVSMLVGSPPGYVGYGEGGVLTEAVRRKPYSVILLDEMEKAHPGVQDVFYQVFDKGMLKDGQGRDIDFRNTLILMTSNAGTETIEKLWVDPETMPAAAGLADALRPELLRTFKPAFLGRVTLVPYFPLGPEVLRDITTIALKRIQTRVAEAYGVALDWAADVPDSIVDRCTESQSGARLIEAILRRDMVPQLAMRFLGQMAEGAPVSAVRIIRSDSNSLAIEEI
jgi:type VI secretion system protein VasG